MASPEIAARILEALVTPATTEQVRCAIGAGTKPTCEALQRLHARHQVHIHAWDTSGAQPRAIWAASAGVDAPKPQRVWQQSSPA
ncbi:hypothetical protein [Achromobacter aloeverae]